MKILDRTEYVSKAVLIYKSNIWRNYSSLMTLILLLMASRFGTRDGDALSGLVVPDSDPEDPEDYVGVVRSMWPLPKIRSLQDV